MVESIVEDFNESVPRGGNVTGTATCGLRPYGVRVCVTAKTKQRGKSSIISQSWLRIQANENSCRLNEFMLAQKQFFRRLDLLTVRGYTDTSSDEEKNLGSTTATTVLSTSTTSDEEDNDITKVRNFTT